MGGELRMELTDNTKKELAAIFDDNLGNKLTPALATGIFNFIIAIIQKQEVVENKEEK